jgi:NADPH-dependent curcumin reductase CurA
MKLTPSESNKSSQGEWYTQGKIQYRVDVIEGLENAPRTINKLFDGTHQGKLIIRVSNHTQVSLLIS